MAEHNSVVSIGMPTKNRASVITGALDSLLLQTYTNLELIISDNGSSDETQRICQDYVRRDSRVKYFRQTQNIGKGSADNFDFVRKQARGKYFMWATDDDWWDPRFVETLKNILDKNPEYALAMSSFDRGGEYIFTGNRDLTFLNSFDLFLHLFCVIPKNKANMAIYGLFRKEFLDRFFRRSFVPLPPYVRPERVLLAEMALSTKFYTIPDVLFRKNLAPNQTVRKTSFIGYSAKAMSRMLAFFLSSENVSLTRKLKILYYYSRLPRHPGNFFRYSLAVARHMVLDLIGR